MTEWPPLSLREAHVSVFDCEHRTPPPAEEGYPYIAIPQLRNGRIDEKSARRINPAHFHEWTRRARPQPNDIVLSRRTNPGETAFVPEGLDFALGQNLVLLRSDGTHIYPPYLRWLVRGPDWWNQIGKFLNVGAVFDSLRVADIPNFRLPIPPMNEQHAIARILADLDGKIELNRRMNETLEAIARSLFTSWFVDFDPVHAHAEGRDSGLPSHIADLFPDRFAESELGEIPVGWEVGRLGSILEQRVERCSPSAETSSRPYVPIDSISSNSLFLSASKPGQEAKSSLIRFYEGDLLFGAMRPYFHKVCIAPFDGTTRTTVFVLFPREDHDRSFATLLLHEPNTVAYATRHSTGSTIPYAVWNTGLASLPVVIPPRAVRSRFDEIVRPMLRRIPQPHGENKTLAALRDELLLISGGIRIPHVERLIEAALV